MEADFIKYSPTLMPNDPVEASRDFMKLMKERRSVREFSSKKVDREILLNAIETAGSAPSGANCQPWFFALVESQEMKDQIREAAEEVENKFYHVSAPKQMLQDIKPMGTNENKAYLSEAPALIVVFARHSDAEFKSYYPIESTGIAVGLLLTSLHHSGLATLTHTPKPMDFMNKILKLDKNYKPFMLIVAGYSKINAVVPNIQKLPLNEISSVY